MNKRYHPISRSICSLSDFIVSFSSLALSIGFIASDIVDGEEVTGTAPVAAAVVVDADDFRAHSMATQRADDGETKQFQIGRSRR